MNLMYNGVDIYSKVHIKECVYESYCCNHINYLRVLFEDSAHKFDAYGMRQNDLIRIVDGAIDTENMYIDTLHPINCGYEVVARSAKNGTLEKSTNKEWYKVKFKQVMKEIAERHALQCLFYGVTNRTYQVLVQNDEPDFEFASRIAVLEGCVIVIYNNKMIVASESYLENSVSNYNIDIDSYDVGIKRGVLYNSCTATDGSTQGTFQINDGFVAFRKKFDVLHGEEEAERFAMNLLRYRNKNSYIGVVISDELLYSISAGSVVNIISNDYVTANGTAFLYRVRHDLVKGISKIWFRKCLEGY